MVDVVVFDSVDCRAENGHVESRVVEARKDAPRHDKSHHRTDVAGHEPNAQEVQVLPAHELERVNVDRVRVAPRGRLLLVVVLVHEVVNGAVVEGAVEKRVDQVVDHVERQQAPEGISYSQGVPAPCHRVYQPAHPHTVVHEQLSQRQATISAKTLVHRCGQNYDQFELYTHGRCKAVEPNAEEVCRSKNIEMFPPNLNRGGPPFKSSGDNDIQ
mmetsp:Transcript_55893/g.112030  ORF Transcript_55893/g.112030 Transcript_55893/m.112030 type:complete len:214 (-) Transcript_55893:149-790(-)